MNNTEYDEYMLTWKYEVAAWSHGEFIVNSSCSGWKRFVLLGMPYLHGYVVPSGCITKRMG